MGDDPARLPRPSPLEWVLLAGGLGLVIHHRWLFDDAFVYFRYVDHWVFLDSGLVYNRGEYVEGYSSPLQALLLGALRALRIDYPSGVLGLGCAAYAAFGYGLVVLNRRLAPSGPILNLPLAYLALNYATASFFTSGLETPLEQVWAVWTALFLLRPHSRALAAAVAAAPLVRPELVLALGVAGLHAWRRGRRFPWALAGFALLWNGAWLAFRIRTYADLLPNTFYLKDDSQPWQGLLYLWDLAAPYHLLPLTVAAGVALVAAARRPAEGAPLHMAPRLAMLAAALAVAAYVVRIGGGALHYWYFSFAFPLFVCAGAGIPELTLARLAPRRRPLLEEAALLVFAALVLGFHPRQLDRSPLLGEPQHRQVGVVNDAAWHRRHPDLAAAPNRATATPAELEGFAAALEARGYDAIGASFWCRWIWAHYRTRVVHGFGLTDAVLARMTLPEGRPGHKLDSGRFARQLVELQREFGPGPGLFARALAAGRAPPWVARNREALEIVERKIYNDHDFAGNLALALRFPRVAVHPDEGGWSLGAPPPAGLREPAPGS